MKLLFIIHSLGGGGAERVTATLANYWAAKEWRITVVTLAPLGHDSYDLHPSVDRISLDAASHSGNPLSGLWQNVRRILRLRQVLRNAAPDIAVAMMTSANVSLALAAWGQGVRTVGSERIHPPMHPLSCVWEWMRRHTYGRLHTVTALSTQTADWLMAQTNARRVSVIPNVAQWPLPIQEPKVNVESVVLRGRKILLAVGRLEVQKGFDWLLDVFSDLARKHPEWDLVILGQGSLQSELKHKAHTLGLNQRVFFPGQVGNVGEWYDGAHLYVMSSRFEGFPNTLAEAMAHGLVSVSYDCDTGPRDIIRHEIDGLLVPVGSAVGLAVALDRLMVDSDLRSRFGNRALEVRERFSMEKIASMWETLFDNALREKS